MKFTDASLRALPTPDGRQRLYTDDTLPGFGLRVSTKTKTFVLTHGADRQRVSIGRYPLITLAEARRKAQSILRDRELGITPKYVPMLKAVKAEYLGRRDGEVREATRQGDTYLFKHFDALLDRKLDEITATDIERIIDGIGAPSTRRGAYIRISSLFSYAVRKGYMEHSPIRAITIPPDQTPRYRVLNDLDLGRVLNVARVLRLAGDQYGAIVELLIYTGQRRMQIGALARSMVDFDAKTITWPGEAMKTGKRHVIPMGSAVRALLDPRNVRGLYFPSRVGKPFCGWPYHFRKLTQEVGFSDFVLHDLRRTMATHWQEMGIEIATTEKMLSHSAVTGGLVGIYQRSTYLAQMREAVQKWEEYLKALLPNAGEADG